MRELFKQIGMNLEAEAAEIIDAEGCMFFREARSAYASGYALWRDGNGR